MRTRDLPPNAAPLMEATRAIGYSLESAIADVIDNSVAAGATKVSIEFFPIGNEYLAILDNGSGMGEEDLINAMRYGAKDPTADREAQDLGRFGLGLKTASLSQCRRLTVISKRDGALSGARWDLDHVVATSSWSLLVLDQADMNGLPLVDQLRPLESGTLVIWQELDRMKSGETSFEAAMGIKMDRVRKHLSLVFHRYLAGETGLHKLEISVNTDQLKPLDPFLAGKSTQSMDDETIHIQGQKVTVRPYILPHVTKLTTDELSQLGGDEGLKRQQGFYVYRNKRLLIWGTWFRMMRQGDLSKLARVRVDIPNSLDHLWTLDVKKSTAVPPEAIKKNLAAMVERIAEGSHRTWRVRGKIETDSAKVHLWNRVKARTGGIMYEINRKHPVVLAVASAMDHVGARALEQLLVLTERSLPLNALYVDLTTDERVANDTEWTKDELIQTVRSMLATCRTVAERDAMQAQLAILEPFSRHPEMIAKLMQEAVLR